MKHWLLLACAALALAGCGKGERAGQSAGASAESPARRSFGVVCQTMNNPFFIDLTNGIKEVVEARGDEVIIIDSQFNSMKQKNDISDLLLRGVSGVLVNPVNWEGIKGSLIQAKEQGVPCIVVDAPVKDADLVVAQVASDNVEAGRLAARALAQVRRPAKVVILHLSVNKACIDRVEGFREELAKYPDMEIVDTQEGKGTTEGGRAVMLDLLGRYPDINAVFPINDPSALGAISALEAQNRLGDVTVVSVDGSAEALAAIRAGRMLSTSAQFPAEIGRVAAQKMYEHLEGKPVEKEVKIPVQLVTQENADTFNSGGNPS
jgi:ribose transport system substrate-binding protein